MAEATFSLNEVQIETLNEIRRYLDDNELQDWHTEQLEEAERIKELFDATGFPESDLDMSQLDELFHWMKRICNNRALGRNLYDLNGVSKFNEGLRDLLFGNGPLWERVDSFLDLVGVGKATVSHFLYMYYPDEYPIATSQMSDVLEITSDQIEEAERIASIKHKITSSDLNHGRTIRYLAEIEIFKEVKRLLDVSDYFYVNNVLWYEYKRIEEDIDFDVPLSSISIEADLRTYIANNPHVIESGLTLIKEEYDTREIGRIDVLLKDRNNTHIVIETKKGRSSDKVVGQILRYMGWVQYNLHDDVKGVIVLAEPDQRLEYALVPLPNVRLLYYKVNFELLEKYNND